MLGSGLPEIVADQESIARFIFSNGQFNSQGAKPLAFMPEPETRETSVCRHSGEPQHDLWDWAENHGAVGRKIYGVAFIITNSVRGLGLDVAADEPPPKHAAIRNWPWTQADDDLRKAEHKQIAALLASQSRFLKK